MGGGRGERKKKDTSNNSYNKLKHVSVKKLGLTIRKKISYFFCKYPKQQLRHRSFLSSGHDYTYLSTVRPELTEREGNAKTGCKHKPRERFTKLKVTESNQESMHQVALSRVLCPSKKFPESQKWLGKHTWQWGLCKTLNPSGDSMGKLAKYIQCWLLKLSLRLC